MHLFSFPSTANQPIVYGDYVLSGLPGAIQLSYFYRFDMSTFCVPEYGWVLRSDTWVTVPNRLSGLITGRCNGFRPEITWSYAPPDQCATVADLLALCNDGGTWRCQGVTREQLQVKDPSLLVKVTDSEVTVYTRVVPLAPEEPAVSALMSDASYFSATLLNLANLEFIDRSDGKVRCDQRKLGASNLPNIFGLGGVLVHNFVSRLLNGDAFCGFDAMASEDLAWLARADGGKADPSASGKPLWDNIHIKSRYGPVPGFGTSFVFYPQGNDPLDPRDKNLIFHLHERWPDGERLNRAFSRGQDVRYLVVVERPDEADPLQPESLVDGETLDGGNFAFWHISRASSRLCGAANKEGAPGPVDNQRRPCRVFSSPIFASGPHGAPSATLPQTRDGSLSLHLVNQEAPPSKSCGFSVTLVNEDDDHIHMSAPGVGQTTLESGESRSVLVHAEKGESLSFSVFTPSDSGPELSGSTTCTVSEEDPPDARVTWTGSSVQCSGF